MIKHKKNMHNLIFASIIASILVFTGCIKKDMSGNSITQYGITWTFDKPYLYGKFVTGDYWVVGPVKIIRIDPASVKTRGITMNGSQINPVIHFAPTYMNSEDQGYDSRVEGFNGGLNIAAHVSSGNPLTLENGTSLISTRSYSMNNRPQLSDAAVLTVLDSPPEEGSFRPPYAGNDKTVKFNINQIDYSILPSLSLGSITRLSYNDVEQMCTMMKRPWLDHFTHQGEGGQFTSPENNMPNYGREYTTLIGTASLLTLISDSELTSKFGKTKEDFLIGLIQIGIDNYGVLQNNGCWPNNGGHNQGRKWTIIFAGVLLNINPVNNPDSDGMRNVKDFVFSQQWLAGGRFYMTTPFAEDQTISYVSSFNIAQTRDLPGWGNKSLYPYLGPDQRDSAFVPYTEADIGLPEWGILAMTSPEQSNKLWDTMYRLCCTGNSYSAVALTARILEPTANTMTLWNNPAFFDYVDRYMMTEAKGSWTRSWSVFNELMWDANRDNYGPCYYDLVSNVRQYGDCSDNGVVK